MTGLTTPSDRPVYYAAHSLHVADSIAVCSDAACCEPVSMPRSRNSSLAEAHVPILTMIHRSHRWPKLKSAGTGVCCDSISAADAP